MRLIHSFLIYAYNQTPQAVSNSQTAVIKAKKGVDPIIKIGLRWVALAIVLIAGPHSYSSAQTRSIKLFDATPVFDTGPNTSLDRAIPFATRSVVLTFTADDSAILSSTADGTGPLVIDNFISINGVNACFSAMGTIYPGSCFGPFIDFELPINAPIETILTPIPPIDVT